VKKFSGFGFAILLALTLFLGNSNSLSAESDMVKVIIGFNKPAGLVDEAKIRFFGGRVSCRYHRVSAISAEVPSYYLNRIRTLHGVQYVEYDSEVAVLEQTIPWGISAVNAVQTQSYNQGAGIKVAVIDTGIDLTHPDLAVAGDVTYVRGTNTGNDDNGHGTHVAGIIAAQNNTFGVLGVAPQASLFAVKVLSSSGSGTWSSVISGIQWAIDNDMDVINLSLGSSVGSTALKTICDNAYNAGILILAAAGNSGRAGSTNECEIYPARYDSVIAVGAVDSNLSRANFSSTGASLELAAPGVAVYSTYRHNTYTEMNGTSMACPHAAGVAALVMASGLSDNNQNGNLNDEARAILRNSAHDLGTTGWDREYGYGLVDAAAAVAEPVNRAPTADAGEDRTVFVNSQVTLDGSGSTDPDNDLLTCFWEQTAGPVAVSLSDNAALDPTFTPAQVGIYGFQLTVSDGEYSDEDNVSITVRNENSAPGAPLVTISPEQPRTGDNLVCAALSADVDGDNITYAYTWYKNDQLQGSHTSGVVSSAYTAKGQTWKCLVTPNDGFVDGPSGSAEVTILNTPPVAEAGNNRTVEVNTPVSLDGTGSSDADNDTLDYNWVQTAGPLVDLLNSASAIAVFTPTENGTCSFELTVSDGENTSSDNVTIEVSPVSANSLHIESIEMTLVQRYNGSRTYAIAVITVRDSLGNPVQGVTVSGHWSDAVNRYISATTGVDGQVLCISASLNKPATGTTFTFTVDSLSKTDWNYDTVFNKESSDSVSVP
jgi:hypothetical protein